MGTTIILSYLAKVGKVYRRSAITTRKLVLSTVIAALLTPNPLLTSAISKTMFPRADSSRPASSEGIERELSAEKVKNRGSDGQKVSGSMSSATTGAPTSTPCTIYPIALNDQSLRGIAVGSVINNIYNGAKSGNFGWLTWTGSTSVPTLVRSLTPPGDSNTYVNPDNHSDHEVTIGDWVRSKPGVSNSSNVRNALETLKRVDITVPVWDRTRPRHGDDDDDRDDDQDRDGNTEKPSQNEHTSNHDDDDDDDVAYHVSAFAIVRLLTYNLPERNRISARFLGFTQCPIRVNQRPVVDAGPDQIISLPSSVQLSGRVTDDELPSGSNLNIRWSKLSGPGTVTFAAPTTPRTQASFSMPGTYSLRLTASDGQLTGTDDVIVTANVRTNHAPHITSTPLTEFAIGPAPGRGSEVDLRPWTVQQYELFSQPDANWTKNATNNVATQTVNADASFLLSDFDLSNGQMKGTLRVNSSAGDDFIGFVFGYQNSEHFYLFDWKKTDQSDVLGLAERGMSVKVFNADSPLTSSDLWQTAGNGARVRTLYHNTTPWNGSTDYEFTLQFRPGEIKITVKEGSTVLSDITVNDATYTNGRFGFYNYSQEQVIFSGFRYTSLLQGTYTYDVEATDPDNDTLSYSLATAPLGMSINSTTGLITWPVTSRDVGEHNVTVLVHDPDGLFDVQSYMLTVNNPNQPPVVNAGPDQTIELPGTATLNGAVTDDGKPLGSTLTINWSQVSGAGTASFGDSSQAVTTATFDQAGTYVLRLTANDTELTGSDEIVITVSTENQAPVVSAGTDQTISLPTNSATLIGTATDDGLPIGSTLTTTWSQVSGPDLVSFADGTAVATVVTFGTAGTYVLRLTASDSVLTSSDDVTITVGPENQPPVVSAGMDQTITLPSTANLNGAVSDDGLPAGSTLVTSWSVVGGPGTVTFGNAGVTVTTAAFSAGGSYVLRLSASDSQLTSSDDVTVTVNAANQGPTVNAGINQTISLPNAAQLNGAVTDDGRPAGSTLSVTWSRVGGPGTVTFNNPQTATTSASFSATGLYVLRLSASDSQLTSSDDITITVDAANQPPTVNAGSDQTITLPNAASLNGSVSDDGLPAGSTLSTTWSVVGGPGAVTFDNPQVTVTTAHFSAPGSYVLSLTAGDSQLTGNDEVTITVGVFLVNQAPAVAAGNDQTITLPNAASLNGTVSDDGLPLGSTLSTTWSQVSGPGTVSFGSPDAAATTASFSAAGTYVLRLSASDSQQTGSDEVSIVVRTPVVDLTVAGVGTNAVVTNAQTLVISGTVQIDIRNKGGDPFGGSFEAIVFEDANGNGTYQGGVDNLLGMEVFTGTIASNGLAPLAVPVSGVVAFGGNSLYAFVDSAHQITELDETNNTGSSGGGSRYQPPAGDFGPKVKWQFNSLLNNSGVAEAPLVAPLIDTNGDGLVNERDVPAVIFFLGGNFQGADSHLMAVRGDNGAVILDIPSPYNEIGSDTNPAVGDLDGDGVPEIVVAECCRGVIICFNNNGTRRWTSQAVTYRSSPTIADLDGDGHAEILYGWTIFNFDGSIRRLDRAASVPSYVGGDSQRAAGLQVVDLDLDGTLEIIAGPAAFDKDGNAIWFWQTVGNQFNLRGTLDRGQTIVTLATSNFFLNDAFTAVANLDNDPNPEIIVVGSDTIGATGICGDTLWVFEHDGRIKPGFPICLYQDVLNGDSYRVGPPAIVNVDDDPEPEIVIPALKNVLSIVNANNVSHYMMSVRKRDGSLKWQRDLTAGSSAIGVPPVVAFDYDGDGKAELTFRDHQILRVMNGSDGATLYELGIGSNSLATSYPVVADADNDGVADIIVPAAAAVDGSPPRRGVVVLSDTKGNWRNARRVWNQWLYHITNVNENVSIPSVQRRNWQIFNNSRTQVSIDGIDPMAAPDLTVSRVSTNSQNCPTSVGLTARIGNGGSLHVGAGQRVKFYNGDPAASGVLLGTAQTTRALYPGEFEDVTLTNITLPPSSQVYATVGDPPIETLTQCNNTQQCKNLASLPHTWSQASGYCTSCTVLANSSAYRGIDGSSTTIWSQNLYNNLASLGQPFYEVRFQFPVNATSVTIQNNTSGFARPNSGFLTGTLEFSNGFNTPFTFNSNGEGTVSFAEQQNVSWVRLNGDTVRPDGPSLSEFIVAGSYIEPQFRINEGSGRSANNQAKSAPGLAPCDPTIEQPPFITSAPPITATITTSYSYQVQAGDLNSDPLSFSLLVAPAGMTINSTGLINWTPTNAQLGSHPVTVQVSDGRGGTAEQSFTLRVIRPNQAPTVSAGPDQTITQNNAAILNALAQDDGLPAGSTLTASWSKVSGPGTVTFGSTTAVATTATFGALGTYTLRLTVSDSQFTVTDEVNITVNPIPPNQPPTVNAGSDQTVTLPNSLVLFSNVTDDGLPIGSTVTSSWSQVSGPGTVTFTPGLVNVVTARFSDPGIYVLRLTASDSQLTGSDDIAVNVIGAPVNKAPAVNAGSDQTINLPNSATLSASVVDDALPAGSAVAVTWSQVNGPATVVFGNPNQAATTASFSLSGTYGLRLSASDSQLTASDDIQITVFDPITGPPPTVSINSPADGSEITSRVDIVGSISNGNWRLEYSLNSDDGSDNQAWTVIASGNSPVTNGLLGSFDPTLLLNGIYGIRLISIDAAGQTSVIDMSAVVRGDQKIGNFSLSFQDLDVPVPGLPIQVIRSYDSRDKRTGDFGVGWTLGIKNVRVEKSGKLSRNWDETSSGGFFPNYCLEQTRPQTVAITFGDGKVYQFQPVATPQCLAIMPLQFATIGFQQIPGSNGTQGAKLAAVGGGDVIVSGSMPGPVELFDINTLSAYNPTLFKLTTAEGFVYTIDQKLGVQSMTDPNGNTLTISSNGIIHSNGKSISFARDALGRITGITDPAGNSMSYTYDSNGNLVSFTDRESNTTTFSYNNSHGLLTINDPRGIQPIRNEYDNDGRLVRHIDAFGKVVTYTHDLNTHQEIITDRLGNVTVHEYDARGNLVRTTNAEGGVTTFNYDARDNKLSETNAVGKTSSYIYDAQDNKISETDPLGNTRSYTYNSRHQALTTTDARGGLTTNTYDSRGNLLSTRDALGNVTSHIYSPDGFRTSTTDALGNVTRYEYDATGNVAKVTDPLGHATSYTYDANGNQLSQSVTRTTAAGAIETLRTDSEHDRLNRLVKTTYPDGSSTEVAYNNIGKQSVTKDQLGHQTSYEYDEMGRLTRTTYPDGTKEAFTHDAEGRRLTRTDRAGRQTSYRYDRLGRLLETVNPDDTRTTTTYDAIGREIAKTDERGNATTYEYDPSCGCAGRRTKITDSLGNATTFTYDANGNQIAMVDARGNSLRYEYDADNRRTRVIHADGTALSTTYDALGRATAKSDQAGKTTRYEYDKVDRLVKVTDALGQVTSYTYDEVGNRLTQTDANNHTTSFEYDSLGRRVRRKLPLAMTESYAYDAAGNTVSRTDFRSKVHAYAYDAMNRLLSKTPDPSLNQPTVNYTYSATGQRVSMVDATGTTAYTYDNRDRLTSKATPQGTLSYTYDAAGNLLTITSSHVNGASVRYAYDALNRLSTVTDNRLTAGTTSYTYDAVGNLTGYTHPNAVRSAYTYNSLNRLTDLSISKTNPLASYAYTLGPAGNRLSVTELSGRKVDYSFDALYRLTNETISSDPVVFNNGSVSYTYDAVGNRLSRTSTLAAVPSANHTYDANDRLMSDTYDANGNTTTSGGGTYAYDFENRLIDLNGGATTIVYDGDGNRVSKTIGGVTTKYLVDDLNPTGYAQVIEEIVSGSVQRVYTYGHDLISQNQLIGGNWAVSFYGYDGHGSVRLLTNSFGAVTDTYDYDAFGNLVAATGTTPNDYLYAGEQFDANVGFYYLRARYMNPATGRFWTMDTFECNPFEPASLHKYLYANDDPVNRIDPSGLVSEAGIMETGFALSIHAILVSIVIVAGAATIACALLLASTALAASQGVDTSNIQGPCVLRNKGDRECTFELWLGGYCYYKCGAIRKCSRNIRPRQNPCPATAPSSTLGSCL